MDVGEILRNNQFAQGGLVLGALGGAIAYVKGVPGRIYKFFKNRYSVTLHMDGNEYVQEPLNRWLDSLPNGMKYVRHFKADGARGTKPGYGSYWMWDGWYPILFTKTKNEKANSYAYYETTEIWFGGRKRDWLNKMLTDFYHQEKDRQTRKPRLYVSAGEHWEWRDLFCRPLKSVILPGGTAENVLADMRRFFKSEEEYGIRNLSWHRGYLLDGVPGSGKSALVMALAWELKKPVYYLDPSLHGDGNLEKLLMGVEKNSIVLMEDADAMDVGKKREDLSEPKEGEETQKKATELFKRGPNLSTLLNLMDGIKAVEGVVYVLTTNHRDKLDPALIRPGRIDLIVSFTHATDDQLLRLYKRFRAGDPTEWLAGLKRPISMAEAQASLLKGWEDETENLRVRLESLGDSWEGGRARSVGEPWSDDEAGDWASREFVCDSDL